MDNQPSAGRRHKHMPQYVQVGAVLEYVYPHPRGIVVTVSEISGKKGELVRATLPDGSSLRCHFNWLRRITAESSANGDRNG